MRIIFTFLVCLFSVISNSQNDFSVKTNFKIKPDNKIAIENFSFTYESQNSTLEILDLDLNISQTFSAKFYDSTYSKDGKFYIISYMSDIMKYEQYSLVNSFIGLFTFFYDDKNGKLLFVKVQSVLSEKSNLPEKNDFYLTELGKLIKEKSSTCL